MRDLTFLHPTASCQVTICFELDVLADRPPIIDRDHLVDRVVDAIADAVGAEDPDGVIRQRVEVVVSVAYSTLPAAVRTGFAVPVIFDPADDQGDDGSCDARTLLRAVIRHEVERMARRHRTDAWLALVNDVAVSLHAIATWDGELVFEVWQRFEQLEPDLVNLGVDRDHIDALWYSIPQLTQPRWPCSVSAAILCDRAGRTMVADPVARLTAGPTIPLAVEQHLAAAA
ncbi:hypothetical protein GCM10011611_02250 [Aliidongia dinghuensis]|uniref:Uncharacterized protein n=1 Tax=Aliidongia dinghuensis TaxID=1867774 RepID=A0A8J3E0B1_9PROT|nr:hypothetical protein [Aliidongia dinghuensis]GGF00198.1 hypothetical protein GCM10011611_02250 [Aliidongia dinghuensis]